MTSFYDPASRKPQPWILIVFIALPLLISILSFAIGQKKYQDRQEEEKRAGKSDIFDKF